MNDFFKRSSLIALCLCLLMSTALADETDKISFRTDWGDTKVDSQRGFQKAWMAVQAAGLPYDSQNAALLADPETERFALLGPNAAGVLESVGTLTKEDRGLVWDSAFDTDAQAGDATPVKNAGPQAENAGFFNFYHGINYNNAPGSDVYDWSKEYTAYGMDLQGNTLLITKNNITANGTVRGNMAIDPSVQNVIMRHADITGDLLFTPATTPLTLIGNNSAGTVNGVGNSSGDPVVLKNGKCDNCGATSSLWQLDCGHTLCMLCKGSQGLQHGFLVCGKHYKCLSTSKDSLPLHLSRKDGENECDFYACHNPLAQNHKRCQLCGGQLCNGAEHGLGKCKEDENVITQDSGGSIVPDSGIPDSSLIPH